MNVRKTLLCSAVHLLLCTVAVAQPAAINSLAFPGPNNSFLGKSGIGNTGIGVDQYTGTAQVNIPVCNLASRELTLPVSLNYTSGRGIKVQDYASSVGLGWQLSAGGGISRVVRCFPDEQTNGYLGTGLWGQKVAANATSQTPLPSQITGTNNSFNPPTADGEPDLFYVQTPYFNFQFVFDENGLPVFSNANGYKIITTNFYNSTSFSNSSFVVIDDAGNKFFFGSSSQSKESSTAKLFNTSYTFPTTWYLDKILTFNSKDSITLNYSSYTSSDVFNHYRSATTTDAYGQNATTDQTPIQTTVSQPKVVTSIVSLLGQLDFSWATGRTDDPGAVRLSSISQRAANFFSLTQSTLKTYTFNYSYFNGTSADANLLRLRLDNFTVAGNTSATSTPMIVNSFFYNTLTDLPSRQSLYPIDYWGYYTAPGTNNYNTPLPPSLTYAMADVLTSVSDLSGSTWTLYYELNDYLNTSSNSNVQVGGLRVRKLLHTQPTGENLYSLYSYADASNKSTGRILSSSYQIDVIGGGCDQNGQYCSLFQFLSESPSEFSDINGNFVGYSSVKETNQNGGYTITQFTNFDTQGAGDIMNYAGGATGLPDITSSTSAAYRRGLPLDKTIYDASGNKISEDVTPLSSYSALTSLAGAWAFRWSSISLSISSASYTRIIPSVYHTNIENYRLVKVTHNDFDQANQSNIIQKDVTYTYAANNRLIKTATETDSKSHSHVQTFYHVDDSYIPMITTGEQVALTDLFNANKTNVLIHSLDNRNGIQHEVHNSYTSFTAGPGKKTYLTGTSTYATASQNLIRQQTFNYDQATSNLLSSNDLNAKITSYQYDYNSCYPVAQVTNASSVSSGSTQPVTTYSGYFNLPGGAQVTTSVPGDITLQLGFGSYNSSNITNASYTITGPQGTSINGYLCYSMSGAGCSYSDRVTLSSMPAGTYTITGSANSTYPGVNPNLSYSVPVPTTTVSYTKEFFYEGFEKSGTGNIISVAHTGNVSYSGSYTVPFAPPNSRQYVIQWWSYANSVWSFHEQAYVSSMVLNGQIDDIRVFPADAQIETATFNPLVGKLSVTDPSGRSESYQYDGLQRMNLTLDNDNNITKALSYSYAGAGQYTVTLFNNTTYPAAITSVTIDGAAYPIPAPGVRTFLPVVLPPGSHTISLSYGPSSAYLINGMNYSANQTNPAITYTVNANLSIVYMTNSLSSLSGNLTSDAAKTTACSCHGCQYTSSVYCSGTLGNGSQLYLDQNLTQKVTGKTWFMNYSDTKVWPLNGTGQVINNYSSCP